MKKDSLFPSLIVLIMQSFKGTLLSLVPEESANSSAFKVLLVLI